MTGRGYYKQRVPGTLKGAEAALVSACGGPAAAAKVHGVGVGKTTIHKASDADHPDCHLNLQAVMVLEAHCGLPLVSSFLLAERGILVDVGSACCSDPLAVVVGRITTEVGELLSAAARDVAANKLTRANAINVLRETEDVCPAVLQLRALARRIIDGGE